MNSTTVEMDLKGHEVKGQGASAATWPNNEPNCRKTEKSAAEFTGSILQVGLDRTLLGTSAFTLYLNSNFSRLPCSLLGASTRAFSTHCQPPKTLGHSCHRHCPRI